MLAAKPGSAGMIDREPPDHPPFYPRWEDFTTHGDSIRIEWRTKTKTSIRTLTLPQTVYQALRDHLTQQETIFPHAEYVFISSHGTAIDPRNLLRRFKTALERAKLPATTRFHDLRHSCATFLIAQGEHPRVIMDILGHAQMSTTMDIYGHVMPSTQRAAAAKLDELLSEAADSDQQAGRDEGDEMTADEGD